MRRFNSNTTFVKAEIDMTTKELTILYAGFRAAIACTDRETFVSTEEEWKRNHDVIIEALEEMREPNQWPEELARIAAAIDAIPEK